jgi:2-furoyl-CoA dehydrogenase FAD binding subunit
MARRHGDLAVVAVAVKASREGLRIAIGGVADRPTVRELPAQAVGGHDEALNALAWELDATDDIHASARYRRELVRRLGRRMIDEAQSCLN